MNWSSLYLNKEKEENICGKILFSFQMRSIARDTMVTSARKAMAVPQAVGSHVSVWVAACRSDPIYLSVYLCLF